MAILGPNTGVDDTRTLTVFNPQSGDTLAAGLYVIQGLAYDSSAQSGSGIDSIQAFLDPRDQGGQYLGAGATGSTAAGGGVYAFQLSAALPSRSSPHTLSLYAHSSVSERETSVMIPISID